MPEIRYNAQEAFANNKKAQSKGSKHVFVMMDESGSMDGLQEAVTTGCNEFIHSFAEDPDAKIWLAWFDHSPGHDRTRFKVRGERAADVKHLMPGDYSPTDGYENASEHSTESIRRLLSAREEKGWGIVFLGANQNAVQTAAEFGMTKPGRAFNFDASDEKLRSSMKNVSDVAKMRMEKEAGLAGRELYDAEVAAEYTRRDGRIDGDE
jgi:hypothetical protein